MTIVPDAFDDELHAVRERVLGVLLRARLQIARSSEQVAAARRLTAPARRRRRSTRSAIVRRHLRLVWSRPRPAAES